MKSEQVDLGGFISSLSAAIQEEPYEWRFHSVLGNYLDIDPTSRQLVLLASFDKRDDYSVVEVATRQLYKAKKKEYPMETVTLAIAGDNKCGRQILDDIGVSMGLLHVVEIASLTFYRGVILTPIHQMLAQITKVTVNFPSPWGEWPLHTWSKMAYNYGDLVCSRQYNLTEDQQRRIEGLALDMLKSRPLAYSWLCENPHSDFTGLCAWDAVKKFGFDAVVKHLCWIDRADSENEK